MGDFSMELNEEQLQLQDWVHQFSEDVIRPSPRSRKRFYKSCSYRWRFAQTSVNEVGILMFVLDLRQVDFLRFLRFWISHCYF